MRGLGFRFMNWKSRLLKNFSLYAVTDLKTQDTDFLRKAEEALKGGVDVLQLRSKTLSDGELLRVGIKLRELTEKHKRLFIVNDRVDLLQALDADGIHLGQEDMPVSVVRKLLGSSSEKIIGKSAHSLEQVKRAEEEGVDYIGVGPIYPTPTKPDYPPVGLNLIRVVEQAIHIPFVVIGGINESNMEEVLQAGARRVAVVRAIWDSQDTFSSARRLKERLNHYAMSFLQV